MADRKDQSRQNLNSMTVSELHKLVEQVVEEKLASHLGPYSPGSRNLSQVLDSMWSDIIKAEPGVPSPLELLREERGQWYKPS